MQPRVTARLMLNEQKRTKGQEGNTLLLCFPFAFISLRLVMTAAPGTMESRLSR